MKINLVKKALSLVVLVLITQSAVAAGGGGGGGTTVGEGGNSSGGGGPDLVGAGALKLLIDGGGLKKAMLNYVNTLQIDQVEDQLVQAKLSMMMKANELQRDIEDSRYVFATKASPCRDAFDQMVPASTLIGRPRSPICFDIEKLVKSYKGMSEEDVMVQFASLAFHEHTHHYQKFSPKLIQENEDQANRIAGYVLVTAKFVQLPLLKWSKSGTDTNDFQSIQSMFTAIKAKEKVFMAPKESDYKDYPDFKNRNDRGLFRLLPRDKYDNQLSISGSGAYYSFKARSNEYGNGSDIGLEQNALSVGHAGCDFGFFVRIGDVPLLSAFDQSLALQFLLDFKPAHNKESEVRIQQNAANYPTLQNGFTYINRVRELHVGETFALRSINYGTSDILVAFKIVRIDQDGSMILAWIKIQEFETHHCG